MSLLVLDAGLGVMLLVAIGLSARAPAQKSDAKRAVGWFLVAVPLPAAVALHVARVVPTATDQGLFVTGVVAFAIGSAILVGARDDDDWREAEDGSPPWWPEFERELADYRRRSSRPRPVVRA